MDGIGMRALKEVSQLFLTFKLAVSIYHQKLHVYEKISGRIHRDLVVGPWRLC